MEPHEGSAELTFFESKQERALKGSYYSGRGRQTFGTMNFTFQEKRLHGQLM